MTFHESARALSILSSATILSRSVSAQLLQNVQDTFPSPHSLDSNAAVNIEAGSVAELINIINTHALKIDHILEASLREYLQNLAVLAQTRLTDPGKRSAAGTMFGHRPLQSLLHLALPEAKVLPADAATVFRLLAIQWLLEQYAVLHASARKGKPTNGDMGATTCRFQIMWDSAKFLERLLVRGDAMSETFSDQHQRRSISLISLLFAKMSSHIAEQLLPLQYCLHMFNIASRYVSKTGLHADPGLLQLLVSLAADLAAHSQRLTPAEVSSCLAAFSVLGGVVPCRMADVQNHTDLIENFGAICQDCNLAEVPEGLLASLSTPESLSQSAVDLMRTALLLQRRLSVSEAARVSNFCVVALDSPLLDKALRTDVVAGLSYLMERLCWMQKDWSVDDRRLLSHTAALLRSEFPSLLGPSSGFSRSVLSRIEDLASAEWGELVSRVHDPVQ